MFGTTQMAEIKTVVLVARRFRRRLKLCQGDPPPPCKRGKGHSGAEPLALAR